MNIRERREKKDSPCPQNKNQNASKQGPLPISTGTGRVAEMFGLSSPLEEFGSKSLRQGHLTTGFFLVLSFFSGCPPSFQTFLFQAGDSWGYSNFLGLILSKWQAGAPGIWFGPVVQRTLLQNQVGEQAPSQRAAG